MSRIGQFPNVGIESISWSRLQRPDSNLPEKSLKPLGATRPSYLARVFKTHGMEAHIEDALSYQVDNDQVLTPANYQDILAQLRHLVATTESEGEQREIFDRTFQLLDQLAGNIHQLNLNRWAESRS